MLRAAKRFERENTTSKSELWILCVVVFFSNYESASREFNCANLRHTLKSHVLLGVGSIAIEYNAIVTRFADKSFENNSAPWLIAIDRGARRGRNMQNLRISARKRRLVAVVVVTLFMVLHGEHCARVEKKEKRDDDRRARAACGWTANRLATSEKKEGEGRTGTALVAQRHPVNSAASKRLTVVPWRRSILEIQPYTIRSRVHGAAAAPHRATTLHSASFRFAPAARSCPYFSRRVQDRTHSTHTCPRHFTVPDSRWNVAWITNRGKGEQVSGGAEATPLRSFSLSNERRGAGCVDRIRSRFAERKDSQRVRCLARRALIARFRYATPYALP